RARCLDASEMAATPNTTWPARSRALPRADPTRPAETIPTVRRAGAGSNPDAALSEIGAALSEVGSEVNVVLSMSFQSRRAGTGRFVTRISARRLPQLRGRRVIYRSPAGAGAALSCSAAARRPDSP